jgi:hypothetical protein
MSIQTPQPEGGAPATPLHFLVHRDVAVDPC